MTLDMVFAPQIPSPRLALGGFWNGALFRWPMYLAGFIVPGWIVQKLMFIGLFTALVWHGYRFILSAASRPTRVFMALFYTFNPFVYTRFLAGQWTILLAYSFFPLVWYYTARVVRGERWSGMNLALVVILVFAFSLHLGVIALLILAGAVMAYAVRPSRESLRQMGWSCVLFLLGTTYWTIPALLREGGSIIEVFDERHLMAFRTATHPVLGTLGNVLALGGFWGEHEPWSKQFIWSFDAHPWIVGGTGAMLAGLVLWGIWSTLRTKDLRRQGIVLLVLGVLAVIFSCGVGETIFLPLNRWLFTHVGLWSGFRDSQKWSSLLVLVYAYFAGQGIEALMRECAKRIWISACAVLCVLVFTYPMLFGFWGQLKPVWYPPSWQQANEQLKKTPSCRVLFLPWHGYFSLAFNHGLLTANPARSFFTCDVIDSRQVELGEITNQGLTDPAYDAMEGIVTGRDHFSKQEVEAILEERGITTILLSHDLLGIDPWDYAFLERLEWKKTELEGLTMYQRAY